MAEVAKQYPLKTTRLFISLISINFSVDKIIDFKHYMQKFAKQLNFDYFCALYSIPLLWDDQFHTVYYFIFSYEASASHKQQIRRCRSSRRCGDEVRIVLPPSFTTAEVLRQPLVRILHGGREGVL